MCIDAGLIVRGVVGSGYGGWSVGEPPSLVATCPSALRMVGHCTTLRCRARRTPHHRCGCVWAGSLKCHPKHSRKRGVCWWRLRGQSELVRANVARGRCDAGLAGESACQPVGRRRGRSGRTNCGGRVGITGRSPPAPGYNRGDKKVRCARGAAADLGSGIEHKGRRSGSAVGSWAQR